ncbi:hypothetical protein [Clostridium gasigenes]|uniref:Uncharacterized protein n=1 Tax=Clostridium gasigenes TaxID=94869 RepID=A0A1H0M6I5_9CLOT|nr:hypothetical protein [Clostridium gasigenes]SDO75891.1 hypothetical protein SAMN04488529_101336 [Clostridium gasigenes]
MVNLKGISTKELIGALMIREDVRSMEINTDEVYRISAVGNDGGKDRYMKGRGKVKILEIKNY